MIKRYGATMSPCSTPVTMSRVLQGETFCTLLKITKSKKLKGSLFRYTVIVRINETGESSSNARQGCLSFNSC